MRHNAQIGKLLLRNIIVAPERLQCDICRTAILRQNGNRFSSEGENTMKDKKKNNAFYVRVYDDDILTSLYELFDTKQFDSMNDLMNKALSIGVEQIYLTFGKQRALTSSIEPVIPNTENTNEVLRRLKDMELTTNDLFVILNVLEVMITTLYNVEVAKHNGEPVSGELMDSGYFSTLPERYQSIKDTLIRRIEKKKQKR